MDKELAVFKTLIKKLKNPRINAVDCSHRFNWESIQKHEQRRTNSRVD